MINKLLSLFGLNTNKGSSYLHQEDDKEVEIGDSSKLFKQVLWQKVPNGILRWGNREKKHSGKSHKQV